MRKTYTPYDLIRFIYHETTAQEEQGITDQLLTDPALMTEYRQLVKTVTALEDAPSEPHSTSISIIMEYSASLNEKTVH